jgi:hypothetical protein
MHGATIKVRDLQCLDKLLIKTFVLGSEAVTQYCTNLQEKGVL